jgi:hypothetical protein
MPCPAKELGAFTGASSDERQDRKDCGVAKAHRQECLCHWKARRIEYRRPPAGVFEFRFCREVQRQRRRPEASGYEGLEQRQKSRQDAGATEERVLLAVFGELVVEEIS